MFPNLRSDQQERVVIEVMNFVSEIELKAAAERYLVAAQ
jgi:hypothetical protein